MSKRAVRVRIMEKGPFLRFAKKRKKRPKIRFLLYKHPPNGSSLLIIWEKSIFFFWQLFPVVAGTWLGLRSGCFFWPKSFCFRPVPFFDMGPRFSTMNRLKPSPLRSFWHLRTIFRLFFPSYGLFRGLRGRKMAIFGHSYPCREVPLILVRIGRNLVGSSG